MGQAQSNVKSETVKGSHHDLLLEISLKYNVLVNQELQCSASWRWRILGTSYIRAGGPLGYEQAGNTC